MQGPISSLRNILIHNNIFELYCRTKGPARCRMATSGWPKGSWSISLLPHNQPIARKSHNLQKWSEVAQSCLTVCDPMDCSLPGSSVHGIFQVIVLEWIAISFSRVFSQPRNLTQVSRIVDRRFTIWATREVQKEIMKPDKITMKPDKITSLSIGKQ